MTESKPKSLNHNSFILSCYVFHVLAASCAQATELSTVLS